MARHCIALLVLALTRPGAAYAAPDNDHRARRPPPPEWRRARSLKIHYPSVQELCATKPSKKVVPVADRQRALDSCGITRDEHTSLRRYVGHGFWAINGFQKGYDPLQYRDTYARELGEARVGPRAPEEQARATTASLIQADVANIKSLLGKLPAAPGVCYRAERVKPAVLAAIEKTQQLVTPCFWSTERNLDKAMGFFHLRRTPERRPVLFVILGQSGRPIDPLASYGENETLFDAGVRFKVRAVDKAGYEQTRRRRNDLHPIFVLLEEC